MTLAVGVDLGGTNVRAALVDVEAGVLAGPEHKVAVTDRAPTALADQVAYLADAVDPGRRRSGVGIGIAAMLRGFTGVVVNSPNLGWREVDFRRLMRARLGEQVELYNDLKAITFGEVTFGSARGVKDVFCCYVGTGVGAGLVVDGRLYFGATHLAGEFGHIKVVPGGRLCGCGARGCLEAYVSGANIAARAREELRTLPSLAVELAGGLAEVHAGFLDEAARRGDAYAEQLWAEVAELLGVALANAVTTFNPSRLVLGGGVWQGAADLRRRTLEAFYANANRPSLEEFDIVETTTGDRAGVLGSAALIARGYGSSA